MARNVVVTGGATGIGRAVAEVFATEGANVLITGRRPGPLKTTAAELGPGVRDVPCDGSDPAQVEALRAHLPASVDVLVNCAGGNTDFDRPAAEDLTALAANWRANLDANLISAVLMTAAVRDRLSAGGTVVNIGSIAADKGAGAYGAATSLTPSSSATASPINGARRSSPPRIRGGPVSPTTSPGRCTSSLPPLLVTSPEGSSR